MGSSGAGKSTLMNILARRNLTGLDIKGTTRLNGQAYTDKISNVSRHRIIEKFLVTTTSLSFSYSSDSSYVQQDDIFIGTLTVKEYITFTVKLRLSKESTDVQNSRIKDLIMLMSLQEKL